MQLFLPHRFWETGGMAVDGAHHWLALKLQPLGLQHRSSMQATWASLAMLIWLRLRLSINCLKKRGANLVLICLWKSGVKFAPIKMCNSAMERNFLHVSWSTPIKLLLAFIRSLRMVDFDVYCVVCSFTESNHCLDVCAGSHPVALGTNTPSENATVCQNDPAFFYSSFQSISFSLFPSCLSQFLIFYVLSFSF